MIQFSNKSCAFRLYNIFCRNRWSRFCLLLGYLALDFLFKLNLLYNFNLIFLFGSVLVGKYISEIVSSDQSKDFKIS